MQMEARSLCQPAKHLGMLVRGVVVQNQVHVHLRRGIFLDLLEELQPPLVTMPGGSLSQNLAVEVIEGCKQRHRPVPVVVMGASGDVTLAKRQTWLRPLQ